MSTTPKRFIPSVRQWPAVIRHGFSKVPLIGPLFYCGWKDHAACLKEISISLAFATGTFWLTAIFLLSLKASDQLNYFQLLHSTVKNGELFIFAVGFLGPILLITAEDPDSARPFPGRTWHIFAFIILGFLAAGFHSQIKSAQFEERVGIFNEDFLLHASMLIGAAAIVLRYLAVLYRKSTFAPKKELKDPEVDFAKTWGARHEEAQQ